MFGYIIPYKDELKVKEYNLFKAYYCGLCKELGKEFNHFVRMGLNYDLTFLAFLLSCLDEEDPGSICAEGCIANPIKKKPIVKFSRTINYSSHMSIILAYFKLLDDWRDDKSIIALMATSAYLLPIRKVRKIYPDKYINIKEHLKKLTLLERGKCDIIDEAADVFGKLMEEVFTPPFIQQEDTKRIVSWLGYNIGRWIYILDAFDDIEEDIKKNNYNSILLQYKYDKTQNIETFKKNVSEKLEISLTFTLDNIAKSFELIDIKHNKSILENIIYMGMQHKTKQTLGERGSLKGE